MSGSCSAALAASPRAGPGGVDQRADRHVEQGRAAELVVAEVQDGDERDALLATAPHIYEAGWTTNSSAWVTIHLALADREEVSELLEEARRMTATKKAIKAYDESRAP